MKHRKWLLFAAGVAVAYALVVQHVSIPFLINYGEHTFLAAYNLAFVLIASWTMLECVHHVSSKRAPNCSACGYSLAGMRCPECGKVVGSSQECNR
ncbi:MAG: hypothetical protein H6815_07875 [Phycisphaeraceae bacterium]|nr:hypothetical protein [Phycisphaerales bacterium]MCB9860359.1 hypothetical protein [Phycisphaeraceae bacterium]